MKTRVLTFGLILMTVWGFSPALARVSAAGAVTARASAQAHIGGVHTHGLPAHMPLAVTFQTDEGSFGRQTLYTAAVDGSNARPFLGGVSGSWSAWTRNGSRIAYVDGNSIYSMNPDGTDWKSLSGSSYFNIAWSPNGTQLAFMDQSGWPSITKADGHDWARTVFGDHNCFWPRMFGVGWLNDATLLFSDGKYSSSCDSGIFSVPASATQGDGTTATLVHSDPGVYGTVEASPIDHTTLAYIGYDSNTKRHLYVNGVSILPDTRSPGSFDWSPDAKLFVYDDLNTHQIYVVDASGGNEVNVTSSLPNAWDNQVPSFQPLQAKSSVGDVTVTADSSQTTQAHFPITISPALGQDMTMKFATAAGTAKPGKDYTEMQGTFTVPAGAATVNLDIPVLAQPGSAADKTFTLTLSNPSLGTLDRATATATIQAQPTLTSLDEPRLGFGAVKGGYSMTFSGTHLAGAKEVRFLSQTTQAVLATAPIIDSTATRVHVTAPDVTKAAYDTNADVPTDAVIVVPGDGQQFTTPVTPSDHFTFGIPAIISISPNKIVDKGGATITVTGRNFTGADEVSMSVLGENHVDITTARTTSDNELTFKAPDLTKLFKAALVHHQVSARGIPYVNVRILVPLQGSMIKTVGSEIGLHQDRLFQSPVDVTSVSPAFASAIGDPMTIKGHGFTHALSVTFKYELGPDTLSEPITVQRSSFKAVSDTQFTVPGPNLLKQAIQDPKDGVGTGNLKVHTVVSVGQSGQTPTESDDVAADTFVAGRPRILKVFPNRVELKGGKTIVLKGEGFTGAANVTLQRMVSQDDWQPIGPAKAITLDKTRSSTQVSFRAPDLKGYVPAGGLAIRVVLNVPVYAFGFQVDALSSDPKSPSNLYYLDK